MFTGLIEAVGRVQDIRRTSGVFRLTVECAKVAPELIPGQSVAVSGACLSVVALRGNAFDVEMMPETAARTRFSSLSRGDRVNIERAIRMGDRLDGHLVLGHIDGTAVLRDVSGGNRTKEAWFRASKDLMRTVVKKGSIAIDGVSLTVIDAEAEAFSVGLIPTTLEGCTLGELGPGDTVNIETDIIGKYMERLLRPRTSGTSDGPGSLTLEELCDLGY
ncbi:MAG: riboflavin synthase [Synergistaceae bacterium]|jgi:riboflavin synthase|nr:riboflavin synthase [Synergistaceae bacterium]